MVHPYDVEFLARQAVRTRPHRLAFYRRVALGTLGDILEVGAGSGEIIGEIAGRTKARCVGVEPDANLLNIARKQHPTVDFQPGVGEHIPFPDASFDMVLAHFTLMWCQNPAQVIGEMYRVTRNGGWIAALAEPDYGGLVTYPPGDNYTEEQELKRMGANTKLGRELPRLFGGLRWNELEYGVLGADKNALVDDSLTGVKVGLVFLPIFWSWGKKP
jgi:ubiquinone/menaquinone biosynthesis C-methylase UbiE